MAGSWTNSVGDPVTEELRARRARSWGQQLHGDATHLASLGLARDGRLTEEGEMLQDMLERIVNTR